MSAIEIYLCKPGQDLKQGRVEYSDSIENRADAEHDAEMRCLRDKTLAKIAYYKVNAEGDFKVLYTYNNPHIQAQEEEKPKKKKKKPVKKKGLFARLMDGLSGDKKKKSLAKKKTKKKS